METTYFKILKYKTLNQSKLLVSRAALGMTMAIASVSPNKINSFKPLPIHGPSAHTRDITHEGRVCRVCFEWKTFENFHRNRTKLDGVETQCKSCVLKKKSKQRCKRQVHEDIELRIGFTRSNDAWTAIDGILDLICDEVVE